ncbi:glycerate kinase [Tyzzerella sp. An114]|uniref:glycerate kinase family protein n=1 Tax=Tyzzerella sp. An114 TaxID=1965545 RepID=UPI000B453DD3|nr:glycerate kinase [Tyzzerella sp. An114]OUQ56806.1 glycerate kinase [Tyzzerella sp. An114]
MKKCLIMPDSFKGTLSAVQICEIMKKQINKHFPDCNVIAIPVADGGEGTVDSFLYASNAKKIEIITSGPYGECIKTYYAKIEDTAIIEMASAAGLPMVENNKNPIKTTTYGVGTIIKEVVKNGCKNIIVGLGGSCTNDGGVGMARALGTIFYDERGQEIVPYSNEFYKIAYIDNSATEKFLKDCKITAMCDIDNPLCGKKGASYIFGPQKGANSEMVFELDKNLKHLSNIILKSLRKDVCNMPGAGAAGGMGAGIVAFLNGNLKSGIDTVLDFIEFEKLSKNADIIFTGEGKIDSQSLRGKVVIGIAQRAKKQNIPVIAVVGTIGEGADGAYDMGVSSIFSINRQAVDFEKSKYCSAENLEKTMDSILRFYKIIK